MPIVKELFELWSDEPKINQAARIMVGRFIKDYGYEEVKEAFIIAATKEQLNLSYVRGILQRRASTKKISEAKNREQSWQREKSIEQKESSEELCGVNLSEIFNEQNAESKEQKEKRHSDRKNSDEYKRAKADFERAIKQ